MRTCLMTNFNMDGCVCEILLSQIYDFDEVLRAGYGKLQTYHKEGKFRENKYGQPFDKLIFSSIQLPVGLFNDMADTYGGQLSVIDHHDATSELKNGVQGPRITHNPNQSSCMSVFDAIKNVGKINVNAFQSLASFANTFEMWKTDSQEWGISYAMNALFWHYNYYNFFKRYKDGVCKESPLITEEERGIIDGIFKTKQDLIQKSVKEEFGMDNNSVLFMNANVDVVSDFALQEAFSNYNTYFIIYNNFQGKQCIAVRVNQKYTAKMTVLDAVKKVSAGRKDIFGGGFGNVGSITIHQEKDLNGLLDIIEMTEKYLTEGVQPVVTKPNYDDDVPFRSGIDGWDAP